MEGKEIFKKENYLKAIKVHQPNAKPFQQAVVYMLLEIFIIFTVYLAEISFPKLPQKATSPPTKTASQACRWRLGQAHVIIVH